MIGSVISIFYVKSEISQQTEIRFLVKKIQTDLLLSKKAFAYRFYETRITSNITKYKYVILCKGVKLSCYKRS